MARAPRGSSSNVGFVKIEGLDDLIRDMEKLPRAARSELRKAMRKAGAVVAKEAKVLLDEKVHTGRVYEVEVKGRVRKHTASAPGEPPAKLLGLLRRSVKIIASRSGLSVRVSSADPKAHIQEYGSEKQAARPFLRPALARKKDEVLKLLQAGYVAGIAKVLRGGKRK